LIGIKHLFLNGLSVALDRKLKADLFGVGAQQEELDGCIVFVKARNVSAGKTVGNLYVLCGDLSVLAVVLFKFFVSGSGCRRIKLEGTQQRSPGSLNSFVRFPSPVICIT